MSTRRISLLYPGTQEPEWKIMPEVTMHDLGMDRICGELSTKESERNLILQIMSRMTADPLTAEYRTGIFDDIYRLPQLRETLMSTLERIDFLRDYGSFRRDFDEKTNTWDLVHRLEELNDYIFCVEALYSELDPSAVDIHSRGLQELYAYVRQLYEEQAFGELKADVTGLRVKTSSLKSLTVGINLNERFEAVEVGLISVNDRPFTKSGVLSQFADRLSRKDNIQTGNEWNENYRYQPVSAGSRFAGMERAARMNAAIRMTPFTMHALTADDPASDLPGYMGEITNHMLGGLMKKLRDVLNKYVTITITDITDLIPELLYYIRWAEYIEKLQAKGMHFACPQVHTKAGHLQPDAYGRDPLNERQGDLLNERQDSMACEHQDTRCMHAAGIYNLKLVKAALQEGTEIVPNDLEFDESHRVYILTGANRGGKTTITQAVGQMFVLAQGGIYIPGDAFVYDPVDSIYTHFPADEDKTLDLGRLGEECTRFRELYRSGTARSLYLLNETFSTTSFEEGYYIARDAVRALLGKGARTIYNTHMHKLARELDELRAEGKPDRAASLTVVTEGRERSFRIAAAPPEGRSLAEDIARKYGVTYELLTEEGG